MSMSDNVKQQVVQELFDKKVLFSWKRATQDSLLYQSGRSSKHIKNMLHILSQGTLF